MQRVRCRASRSFCLRRCMRWLLLLLAPGAACVGQEAHYHLHAGNPAVATAQTWQEDQT
jgi:hypothetical protein